MPIIVGDVVHLDQIFRVDGVNCVVGANYELEDAGTATTDTELLTSLITDNWTATFIDGVWKAANTNTVLADCVKVRKIIPTVEFDFIFLQAIAGTVLTGSLPSHAAAMVTKTSKSNGPGSTGRSFFPAPPELHYPGGRLSLAGQVLWDPVASFLNDILTLGAFSTQWAPQHVRPPVAHTDVFKTWVNPNIRTIRNRQAIQCPV